MIRAILFLVVAIASFTFAIYFKADANPWCLALFPLSVFSLFMSYFSYESFSMKKQFWSIVKTNPKF